jgi:hypothetical protein
MPTSLAEARDFIEAVTAAATSCATAIEAPPEAPHHHECCGRGCERCVFVVYYLALQEWGRQVLGKGEASG